jgi:acetyl esterase/lipase
MAVPELAVSAPHSDPAADVWLLESRDIPVPRGVSAALRQAIANSPRPDVAGALASVPETEAQWRALIAQRAKRDEVTLEALAATYDVSITPAVIAGVAVYRVKPNTPNPTHVGQLFLHLHGGAYVYGGGNPAVGEGALIAGRVGIDSVSIDYRMPPDHPFPAAIDDVVQVYRMLLKDHAAESIAIGGTSAGGGLALAAVLQFKALDLPLVGAIYAGTPWADLTKTGDTLFTHEGIDRILITYGGSLGAAARLYAGGENLKNPLLSPLYGTFSGFPPTYLVTGTRDMFLSDVARTHRKLRQAGVVAELNVYEGMSHADYALVLDSPESAQVYAELGAFFAKHLH